MQERSSRPAGRDVSARASVEPSRVCRDRAVFTALPPAPTSNYWEAMMAATDVVWKALAEALNRVGEWARCRSLG